ncbi:Mariner transposase [Trichomonas vaginalis G3]|uniref:Mariner transposase n=1 Tax=Trichomonas vaginalis (strain ATCC PRA-98 / G3) TaxID=412133 RepID=UPI0021E59DE0|nr:Mariner transposase [Trichomonas vaginalis G3]KAI5490547.1 Mariner transposase [Trichomonas vaginalis G3]
MYMMSKLYFGAMPGYKMNFETRGGFAGNFGGIFFIFLMNHKENILALAKKCKDCKKIYETLVKCFGMDAPSYSTVTYHVRMYHFMNKKAPIIKIDKKSPDQRKIKAILQALDEDPRASLRRIEEMTKIPRTTVSYYLHNYLNYKLAYTRWVPHNLNSVQKKSRVQSSKELLSILGAYQSKKFRFLVTGDESWFQYATEAKIMWIPKDENLQTFPKKKIDTPMMMLSVFWGVNGIIAIDILQKPNTMNAQYLIDNVLTQIINSDEFEKSKQQKQKFAIHFDNSRVHKSHKVMNYLVENNVKVVPNPIYSPDIAPSDFYLFGTLKKRAEGREFASPDDLENFVREQFEQFSHDDLKRVFQAWIDRCERVIESNGDYI